MSGADNLRRELKPQYVRVRPHDSDCTIASKSTLIESADQRIETVAHIAHVGRDDLNASRTTDKLSQVTEVFQ